MIRFKICGITRKEDAILAEKAGAWAIGFIFAKNTPRYVLPEIAREIAENLCDKTEKIGVFVNSSIEEIVEVCAISKVTKIQLHGEESPKFCYKIKEATGKEIIKAIRILNENNLEELNNYNGAVSYILLDSYSEKAHGGSGKTFNWEIAKRACEQNLPIILAGGLTPENIISAYKEVKPYALDLSSGVEKAKGIKDEQKISELKNSLKLYFENI